MNMKSSFFPERESKNINISVVYPGASPEEIETGIVQKIEDNLKGVQGVEEYQSTSQENAGSIIVEVQEEYDTDEVLVDVRNAVDRVSSFPAGMEPPVVSKRPAIEFTYSFALFGDVDLETLKKTAQEVEDDLREIPAISQVEISGFPATEINVALDEDVMRRYQLTFQQVVNAISAKNRDLSAGKIKTETEELLIRYEGKEYYADQIQDVIVKTNSDGSVVRLNEIAVVEDRFSEEPQRTFVDGKPAVVVTVNKIYGENTLEIAEAAKNYEQNFNGKYPNISAAMIDDATESLRGRITLLLENGAIGVGLVILSLALFLNWRLAFWVAMSLPFSFLGMFLMAYFFDITLNVISLFGCIVVVGIVVDDGIVVGEQIFQNYEDGMKPYRAAIRGTLQVLPSVTFAILTTVVAFLPFFFIDTPGPRISDMSFVVIFVLLFSLLEVIVILPAHLAHSKALRQDIEKSKIRAKFDKLVNYPRNKIYKNFLHYSMKHKAIPIAFSVFFFLITAGIMGGGILKTTFFPNIDSDNFTIKIELPSGARENQTNSVLQKIENTIVEVNEELKETENTEEDLVIRVVKNIAAMPSGWGVSETGNANVGNLQVFLQSEEVRTIPALTIASMISERVGPLPEVDKAEFGSTSFFGKPISIPLMGRDLNDLQAAKKELKQQLQGITELRDVTDNDPQGLREIEIELKDKAFILGFNQLSIASQIRQGFFGEEVMRLQRGSDEVKVWVRFTEDYRSSIENFENMRIRDGQGNSYPLSELVDYKINRGSIKINHLDGMREITVEADTKDPKAEVPKIISEINENILNPILSKYPTVKTTASGQAKRIEKLSKGLIILPVAFILMFFLVSLSFRSPLQAILVFALIPFGLMGAMWGHVIQGMSFNVMSFYGTIALIGIIVNDSIVFINTFNDNLKEGQKLNDAIYNAGIMRFRPILLTTVTTVAGLLPLLSETSIQAQFLIPMAISVAYGLLIASVFILLLLPILLMLLSKTRKGLYWLKTNESTDPEQLEPTIIEENMIKKYLNEDD
jgi:multidrug efflux pump subunit AcrB